MPKTQSRILDESLHALRRGVTSTLLLGLSLLLLARVAEGATHDLKVTPARLLVTAQEGASADVVFEVKDAAGAPVTGVSFLAETNFGSLSPVSETAPGHYAARFVATPTDMPREAVVMFSPQGRHDLDLAFVTVPVSVRTPFSAHTEPRSHVSATVGSATFGPVEAGRDGAFDLDVELPPGARETIVRIEDAAGNVTTNAVGVPLRPHDPLTVTLDRYRLTSDGAASARVFAVVLDDRGRPIEGQVPTGTASVGQVSSFEASGDGLFTATYTPPRDGREGVATLEVKLAGDRPATETEQVSLVRGLPGKLRLEADPMELVMGAGTSVALVARVEDAAGNGLAAQPIKLFAERGTLSETADRGDGTYAATLLPPDRLESGTLEVRALLQVGTPARTPAKLSLEANPKTLPTSWKAFSLVTATVTDEQGEAVPGEVVLFHVSRGEGRVTPAALTYDGGRAFADFAADPTEEVVTVEATCTSVPSLRADVQITKSSKGAFTIVSRPALVALGGQTSAVITLGDDKRVLQDTVLLTLKSGAPAKLVASADPTRLPADGQSTSALTATLLDARDNPISDETLAWSVDRGSVSGDAEDDEGRHSASFTAPDGRSAETANILVSHAGSGLSARLTIALDPGTPAHLALATDRDEMPADGNSMAHLVATVTDNSGAVVPQARVSFSLDSGLAVLADEEVESDASGKAATTLRSSLQSGPVDVTAEVRDRALAAHATITLRSMRPERIEAEAVPPRILADGRDRSEIRVQVEDALGQPLEDEPLRLQVRGAARLTDTRVRTDVNGEARAFLSGTVAETAVVTVRSESAPGLVRDVSVELALPLQVSIEHDTPACSLGVGLRAVTDPQAVVSWDLDGDGLPDAAGASIMVPLSPGVHEVRATAAIPGGAAGEARAQLTVLASPSVAIEAPARVDSGAGARLDASASTAADGSTLTFAWDLDDDGAADDATGAVVGAWTQPDGLRVARVVGTDASGCTSRAEASVLFGDPPDMAVTAELLTSPTARPGETARFRVGWRNASSAAATGVELRCLLAGPLTFVASSVPAGGVLDSSTLARFALGDVAAGAAGQFDLDVVAATDIPGGVATASLAVSVSAASGDANPANDTASAQLSIQRDVDLSVTFEAPASRDAGQPLDVAVLVRNSRASDAPDASVELSWNRGEWTATPSPAGTDSGSVLTVPLGTIAAGGVARVDLRGQVASKLPEPAQVLGISARAFYAGIDADPSNDTAAASIDLLAAPDLVLTLQAQPARDPALPGDVVEYVATATNVGTTPARDVTLESRFPAGTVSALVDNPFGGVLAGEVVTFHLGDFDVADTASVRFSVRLSPDLDPAIAAITNQSEVQGVPAIIDLNPANNFADTSNAIDVRPDLVLSVAAPAGVGAGSSATYTMIVANRGARANGVQVALDLSGAPVSAGGGASDPLSLVLDAGSIAWGQSVTLHQAIDVPCPQPRSSGMLASSFDLRVQGLSVSTTTGPVVAVSALEDLAVQVAAPATAAPGQSVVATVTATAQGCAPSEGDTLDVTWPAANVVELSPLRLAVPTLAPGASFSAAVPLTMASVQPQMSNDVMVTTSASLPDSTPADDIDSASISVAATPDIAVVAIDAPPDLAAGASVDVVVHARNVGSTAARGTLVSLATSHPVEVPSITPAGAGLRDLLPGEEDTATFTVDAAAMLANCANATTLTATASCAGDPSAANDAASSALGVSGRPDLSLVLDVSTPTVPAQAGSIATVRCTVTNIGTCPSTAGQIELTRDAAVLLPTLAGHGANTLTYALGTLAPGASVTLTFRFLLPSPLPSGIDVTPVDAVVSDPADTNAGNDSDSRNVQLGLVVDLRARVTLEPETTPSLPDGYVTAIVTVDNLGQRDATNVDVLATWDPLLASGGSLQWSVGPLLAGASAPHTFTLHLAPTMPAPSTTLTLTAAALSDPVANPQLDTTNDTSSASVDIQAESCLRVVLSDLANPAPASPGGQISYTATVTNDGTTAAQPATLTLVPDARLAVVVDAGGGTPVVGGLGYTLASLAPGASGTATATWVLPPFPVGRQTYALTTSASATSPQDPAGGCASSSDSVDTVVSNESDLEIKKVRVSMTEDPPQRGTTISYDITVRNIGQQASPVPVISDEYPPELQPRPPLPPGAADSGSVITWSGASLAPNLSTTYNLKFKVRNSLAAGEYVIHNCGRVTVSPDASPINDFSCDDVNMALDVDLQVALTCTPRVPPAGPDSIIDCTATTTNAGSYDASNVQLVIDLGPLADPEPPGPDPATISLGTLAAGTSVTTPQFSARILPVVPDANNIVAITATASATEADADPSDNSATAQVPVRGVTDLVATLLSTDVNGPPLQAGDAVDLELRLVNAGTKPARNLVASLTWPAPLATIQGGGPFTGGGGTASSLVAAPLSPGDPPLSLHAMLQVGLDLPTAANLFAPCGGGACDGPERYVPDDTACLSPAVILAWPDLVATLTASAPTTPARPGQVITYSLSVTNVGTTAAHNVTFVDHRDTVLTTAAISASVPFSDVSGIVTLTLPDIPVGGTTGASYAIQLAATMPASRVTLLSSSSCAVHDGIDRVPADNCAQAPIDVAADVDAYVTLTASPGPDVAPGDVITLTAQVGNAGFAPAQQATLAVTLPAGVSLVQAPGADPLLPPVGFTLGSVPALSSGLTRTLLVRVDPTLPSPLTPLAFCATVSHVPQTDDVNAGNDTSCLTQNGIAQADLVATLARTSAAPAPRRRVTYDVTWRNAGTTTATNARLILGDADDAALIAAASGLQPGALGRTIPLGDLPPSAAPQGSITLDYDVLPELPAVTNVLTMLATLASDTAELPANLANNIASLDETITARPDPWTTLSLDPAAPPAIPCSELIATVTYGNSAAGETAASGIVTLSFDPILIDQVIDAAGGTPTAARDGITWNFSGMRPGQSAVVRPRLHVACVLPAPSNLVFATTDLSGTNGDLNPANNLGVDGLTVTAAPDLRATVEVLSPVPATAPAGTTLRCRVTVENIGTTRATSVAAFSSWTPSGLIGSSPCGASCTWNDFGVVPVNAGSPIPRDFDLVVGTSLPAISNILTIEGRTSCAESESNGANNIATTTATLTGQPDLRITQLAASRSVMTPADQVRFDYGVTNVGSAPATRPQMVATYDDGSAAGALLFLVSASGAADTGQQLVFDFGADLPPGSVASETATFGLTDVPGPTPWRPLPHALLSQETPPFLLSRDANAADNVATSNALAACVIDATIVSTHGLTACMGGGLTLTATATPAGGAAYLWSCAGGLGRFTSTTTPQTTFFPPVTPGNVSYVLTCRVSDATHPTCFVSPAITITATTACVSCGCSRPRFNVQYDHWFSRVDRPGDRTASPGETVAFVARAQLTGPSKSGWLLGGVGNTRFSFPAGTGVYEAWLPGDIWVDCGQTYLIEFAPAQIPAACPLGLRPVLLDWVSRDDCGSPEERVRDTSSGDQVNIVLPATNGVIFTDWGPRPGTKP